MTRRSGAMHVETSRSHQVLKDGTERVYQRHLLRRSYREAGKVRKETLANLSHLPDEAIEAVRLALAGRTVIDAGASLEVTRSLPHGHVAAVAAMARRLGFPALLGPPGRPRDLAFALIISWVRERVRGQPGPVHLRGPLVHQPGEDPGSRLQRAPDLSGRRVPVRHRLQPSARRSVPR